MEDKRQVVPGLEDNRDVTTTLGVQKAKGGVGKVMGGLGSLLVLVGFVGSNLPLIVGGIVVAVVGAVLGNHAQKVGQAAISQRLVPGALHQVFETVEYPAVQDLTRAQIAEGSPGLPRFDSLYTNDVVSASYQGLPVWLAGLKLCEMALYRDPETEMEKEEEREIFLGLWFACDLGKEIGCDCTITPKGVLGRLTGSRNALGSEVFARKFQVQTDRPDWAERLLTQPVQEAMLSLLSMGKTYLRLRPDGKLTLAVSMGKPMFYLGKGSVQAESIQRRFVEELRGPTRLVDALRRSLPKGPFQIGNWEKKIPARSRSSPGSSSWCEKRRPLSGPAAPKRPRRWPRRRSESPRRGTWGYRPCGHSLQWSRGPARPPRCPG